MIKVAHYVNLKKTLKTERNDQDCNIKQLVKENYLK